MRENLQLSSVEKKRLERSLKIVAKLSSADYLSEVNSFVLRQRMKYILVLLGSKNPDRIMISKGIDIIKDIWPFKILRLRKLVNGRGS